jgi:hypothetical protein
MIDGPALLRYGWRMRFPPALLVAFLLWFVSLNCPAQAAAPATPTGLAMWAEVADQMIYTRQK